MPQVTGFWDPDFWGANVWASDFWKSGAELFPLVVQPQPHTLSLRSYHTAIELRSYHTSLTLRDS